MLMKRIEALTLNTWSKVLWTDEMHARCMEDQITSDRGGTLVDTALSKNGESMRLELPFGRTVPTA